MLELQERDKWLIQLCYEHQFITQDHAQFEYPGDGERNARKRLALLEEGGFLLRQDVQVGSRKHVFRLSKNGRELARKLTQWEVTQQHSLHNLEVVHDAFVTQARQSLAKLWPKANFQPEGAIRDSFDGAEPDGVFRFPSGKWIAIEVENSDKGITRFTNLTKRWLHVKPLIFVLYIATSEDLERTLKRYLVEGQTEQPIGVVSMDGLLKRTPVWSLRGNLPLFDRTEF